MTRSTEEQIRRIIDTYFPNKPASGKLTSHGRELSVRCPLHKFGMEQHPSMYVNIYTGAVFCHTCHKGWSLPQLLLELGVAQEIIETEVKPLFRQVISAKTKHDLKKAPQVDYTDLYEKMFKYPELVVKLEMHTKQEVDYFQLRIDPVENRLVLPIYDEAGRLVCVVGRRLSNDRTRPRYKIYQEFPARPSQLLWNLHRVTKSGRPYVIIVEGIRKGIYLHRHGYPLVVSINGSYFSREQQNLLTRYTFGCIVVLTDGDTAGRKAANFISRVLSGRKVKVPKYPAGKTQPDELTKEELDSMLQEVLV